MLEAVWKHGVLFYAVGVMCVLGVISKITVSLTLRRLVKEAGKMGKSLHPLMKLVRAKFEHACMVSDKVQNIRAFVDKYMYEYKVLWIKLHSWRQMEKAAAWCCLVFGAAGAAAAYVGEAPLDAVVCHKDQNRILADRAYLPRQRNAVHIAHINVQKDHVSLLHGCLFQCVGVMDAFDLHITAVELRLCFDQSLQCFGKYRIIVTQQNVQHTVTGFHRWIIDI